MARALQLAEKGLNTTTPNPRVGCVLVREGRIVGEGFHVRAGEPHAEIHALQQAGTKAAGATAYVTLEPCNHHGRTPPCVESLIQAQVSRVVAAMQDPNPRVAGSGLARLAQQGVKVEVGLLEAQARELNLGFSTRMTRGRPWVRIKIAASLDGKTALENGASQWITGADARRDAHAWRARSCAILTGVGTVLHDNPALNVRDVPCQRQPLRVVVDSALRTPPDAQLFRGSAPEGGPVLIAHADRHPERGRALIDVGAELLALPGTEGQVDLPGLLQALAARGVNELLVEAGTTLNGALLAGGWVDELLLYFAPTLLGNHALGMFETAPLQSLSQKHEVAISSIRSLGQDLRLLARLRRE